MNGTMYENLWFEMAAHEMSVFSIQYIIQCVRVLRIYLVHAMYLSYETSIFSEYTISMEWTRPNETDELTTHRSNPFEAAFKSLWVVIWCASNESNAISVVIET